MIGRGGMGVVYFAYVPVLDRTVTIKRMIGGLALNPAARRRFRTEMHVLAALRDPAIVSIYSGPRTFDGNLYYFMDYIEGWSIKELIDQRRDNSDGPFRSGEVVRLLRPVAEVLGKLHATEPPSCTGTSNPATS